ncbi:MAG TPA: twin-arginine translocase TatA/TatE family subunit [Symbiobacteriaceae bacterium]|nr:twin-arginine translocase TatA/TatE family subunit [Symbiobacteriaceae bacterium]
MLQKIGFTELAVIMIVLFLIFGAGKLPQLGRSVGEGIREFKKAFSPGAGKDEETKAQER